MERLKSGNEQSRGEEKEGMRGHMVWRSIENNKANKRCHMSGVHHRH